MNEEQTPFMEAPCLCDCGTWFDLEDGWGCRECNKVHCPDCMDNGEKDVCDSCKRI